MKKLIFLLMLACSFSSFATTYNCQGSGLDLDVKVSGYSAKLDGNGEPHRQNCSVEDLGGGNLGVMCETVAVTIVPEVSGASMAVDGRGLIGFMTCVEKQQSN